MVSQRQVFETMVNLVARNIESPRVLARWVAHCSSDPERYGRSLYRTVRATKGSRGLRLWDAWQHLCRRMPELQAHVDWACPTVDESLTEIKLARSTTQLEV